MPGRTTGEGYSNNTIPNQTEGISYMRPTASPPAAPSSSSPAMIIQRRIAALPSCRGIACGTHVRIREWSLFQKDDDELHLAEPCEEEQAEPSQPTCFVLRGPMLRRCRVFTLTACEGKSVECCEFRSEKGKGFYIELLSFPSLLILISSVSCSSLLIPPRPLSASLAHP